MVVCDTNGICDLHVFIINVLPLPTTESILDTINGANLYSRCFEFDDFWDRELPFLSMEAPVMVKLLITMTLV